MNWLRSLFGHDTSQERERKAAEVSQLSVDHRKTLRRVNGLLGRETEAQRLATAVRRTVHAVRGGE